MLKIEKNIPLPSLTDGAARARTGLSEALRTMEVGDSVFLPSDQTTQTRISTATNKAKHAHGRSFTTRKVEGGWRVWRKE